MYKKIIHKFLHLFNLKLEKNNLEYFPIETNNFEKKLSKRH